MTTPGLCTTPVRRTVLIAVALVTGQALLCVVIGFVTFGDRGAAPPRPHAAEQPAAPPAVVPPSGPGPAGPSVAPHGPGAVVSHGVRPVRPAATRVREHHAERSPTPGRTTALPASSPSPPAPEPPPTLALLPPPGDGADDPPVIGEPCDDADTTGETRDGRAVRCDRDRDGDLRWREA
ncbi:hypothetical protein Asp14428_60210 [Actinoplanes sp. NBRC 14428]|nr:hypothetical protein Asp14428_60210 [Actinoplanes sp. NBRC 14428]